MSQEKMLHDKTIEYLIDVINEISCYRSGPKLVQLFNQYGFNDEYGHGFPSRSVYTSDKLHTMDNMQIKQLVEDILHPRNFINNLDHLKSIIEDCNKYLNFDGYLLTLEKDQVKLIKIMNNQMLMQPNFDEQSIKEAWDKSVERLHANDLDGAITISRTMTEGVIKDLLLKLSVIFDEKDDLIKLYNNLKQYWKLAPQNHIEEEFKLILGGLTNIVHGLCAVRNMYGDAHMKNHNLASSNNKKPYKLTKKHVQLMINSSATLAMFLYQTYQEKKQNGQVN